ncbi:pyruvate dehydrogenase complex E1 component subunit beta [Roseivivax isoporae]|uniref:Pyruvate dehydrogenase subunit beta n=1 Tax=Roseivivax isoporae LMG 25204 TaxID=1449351 RepID=X7F618_9RHOB|nr:pyruvate dehydrogenase complex E1 component subunit beta [Roseivivax isoporae]ETX28255.1 pyruvate dehydrogenase subunit beta [Roseivivax isoporae LMG 25204]
MPTEILMPALSPTMEEGRLARWYVKEGDRVDAGDVIAEIETDKATLEFEAVAPGRLGPILVPEGAEAVKVNTPIAVLLSAAEDGTEIALPETPPAAPPPAPRPAARGARSGTLREPGWDADLPRGTLTVREALRDALAEEMRRDDDVVLIGEEVAEYQGAYKITQGLFDEFGARRVMDAPITEHAFTGIAVGAAFAGLRPVVEYMSFAFAMQAMDQIVNSAAKTHYMSGGAVTCPLVLRGPQGMGGRVGAQHAQCFASWFAQVPGLKVVAPFAASDAKGLLKAAIRDPNPVVFLESEALYGRAFEVPDLGEDHVVPLGRARVWREGTDVTIVSFGAGMAHALAAADTLAEEGLSAEVIDLRSLRPLDTGTVIESVKRTSRCVTVEDGWPVGAVGDHIAAEVMRGAFDWLDAPVLSVTGRDLPMPYAETLEQAALVTSGDVVAAARRVCNR